MKKIFIFLVASIHLFANVIESPLVSVDENSSVATIGIEKIDVGMSGFVVKKVSQNHSVIVNKMIVSKFDKLTQTATLKLSQFSDLDNDALPSLKHSAAVGDIAVLAFGYSRALLVAPSEEIYYRITKNVKTQWVHPDIFTTILSLNGHPTPLQSDFNHFAKLTSVGLIYIYLDKKLYTIDALSFKILNINDAPFVQEKVVLPFYTRIKEIDANWFGEGNKELSEYEPHYYKLLVQNNSTNKKLHEIIKGLDEKYHHLLKDFDIKE